MSNEDPRVTGSDDTSPQTLSLIAGLGADGEPVMENIFVTPMKPVAPKPDTNHYGKSTHGDVEEFRLLKSPAFARGLAAGDRIRFPVNNAAGYNLVKRSGNLSIRVLRKQGIDEVALFLTPELELLDGTLDLQSPRMLVYSIHVSIGFQQIEALLDRATGQFPGVVWYYGNVYDPADGVTPLNWWQEFLAPM